MRPLDSLDLSRVVVVGTSGAGKTTFAARLAAALSAPHIELDAVHWLPDWQERPADDFRNLVAKAVATKTWVVDGNYRQVRDVVWPRASTVVWLNYALVPVFGRVLARTFRRAFLREALYSGNRETLGQALLTRDSILWWTLTSYGPRRREFRALRENQAFPHLAWVELRQPRQAEAFLDRLAAK